MTETTIEWTRGPGGEQGYTFNPWVGCTKISVGPQGACVNCYAESWAKRAGHPDLWTGTRRRTSESYWRLPLKWDREAAAAGERRRVFCASLADVFDIAVPTQWRADLIRLIRETQNLDWLLLTKRIGNAREMIEESLTEGHLLTSREPSWPWPHVWLGATIANQKEAERDIPKLLALPARVHFLSCEPLLGPINLRELHIPRPDTQCTDTKLDALHGAWSGTCPPRVDLADSRPLLPSILPPVDWVIGGGESGPRPTHPDWARSLRDQCSAAFTPFLWKQWGSWLPWPQFNGAGIDDDAEQTRYPTMEWRDGRWEDVGYPQWPDWVDGEIDDMQCVGRVGKKKAGRMLDGRTWDEQPRVGA